jgi:hypothetical protein
MFYTIEKLLSERKTYWPSWSSYFITLETSLEVLISKDIFSDEIKITHKFF